ncbi:MAG: T9SS type A sorting domain-containing protein, partial [Ignavibacteriaceae bacterium]
SVEGELWCLANNRFYRSIDNGKSWNTTNLPYRDIATFTISENGSIYAASIIYCTLDCFQSGIFYSDDNGESWRTIQIGSPDNTVSLFTTGAQGHVFAYTSDGLYYSDSGANLWSKINLDSSRVWLRTLSSRDNGIVAGVTNNSTYLSLDNGQTWAKYPYSYPSELYINTLAIYNETILFGLDYTSLYRSVDSGQTWEELTLPIMPDDFYNIQITEEGQILVGTDIGAFASWDIGDSWSRIFPYNSIVYTFTLNHENELLVGTSDAVYRRKVDTDWVRSSQGIIENQVSELIRLSNGDLLAGTFYDGLFSTSDGGQNWEQLNFFVSTSFESIIEIPEGEVVLGIIGYPGLYLSKDGLTKWSPVGLKNIGSLTHGIDNTLFAGSVGRLRHGVYRSMDLGETWEEVGLASEEVNELVSDEFGIIYAGTLGNGVFRSEDNGETWEQTGLQGENIRALTTDSGELIFAGTITGSIFRSDDGGDNWENVYSAEKIVSDFGILSNGLIFAGTGSGVYLSEDNGFTWQDYSTGLPEDTYKISLTYDAEGYLYAGTWGDGVFRSIAPITSVKDEQDYLPTSFTLLQNYPNPFNSLTTISFNLPHTAEISLIIYDALGREVDIPVSGKYSSGYHRILWNAKYLSSGVYFYRLQAGDYWEIKRMILLK